MLLQYYKEKEWWIIILNRKWIVYKHTNKINFFSYIGITSREPEVRWGKNGKNYRPCKGRYSCFYNAIKKYGWDNFEHEILETDLTYEQACDKEMYYISFYNTKAPNGYNLTDGGEGACGYEAGMEFRKRRSELTSGGSNPTAKKVSYGDIVFDTINECADYLRVSRNKVIRWITGVTYIPKIHLENNLRFVGEQPNYKIGELGKNYGRKVFYDGILFQSIKSCANYLEITSETLRNWLEGTSPVRKDKWYIIDNKELRYADESFSKIVKMDYSQQIEHMNGKRFYNKED